MITVSLDWNLLLLMVWVYLIVEGFSSVVLGALGTKKADYYGAPSVITGLIMLTIALVVLVW
jgi:hypothetical protein